MTDTLEFVRALAADASLDHQAYTSAIYRLAGEAQFSDQAVVFVGKEVATARLHPDILTEIGRRQPDQAASALITVMEGAAGGDHALWTRALGAARSLASPPRARETLDRAVLQILVDHHLAVDAPVRWYVEGRLYDSDAISPAIGQLLELAIAAHPGGDREKLVHAVARRVGSAEDSELRRSFALKLVAASTDRRTLERIHQELSDATDIAAWRGDILDELSNRLGQAAP